MSQAAYESLMQAIVDFEIEYEPVFVYSLHFLFHLTDQVFLCQQHTLQEKELIFINSSKFY